MPAILINEAVKFFSPVSINTAIVLGREDRMKYPNVTVCFAKFFDQTLLERKSFPMFRNSFNEALAVLPDWAVWG